MLDLIHQCNYSISLVPTSATTLFSTTPPCSPPMLSVCLFSCVICQFLCTVV